MNTTLAGEFSTIINVVLDPTVDKKALNTARFAE